MSDQTALERLIGELRRYVPDCDVYLPPDVARDLRQALAALEAVKDTAEKWPLLMNRAATAADIIRMTNQAIKEAGNE